MNYTFKEEKKKKSHIDLDCTLVRLELPGYTHVVYHVYITNELTICYNIQPCKFVKTQNELKTRQNILNRI